MAARRDKEVWLKFRAVLKTAMQRRGLRGYELAKAAGVWPTNVSHWLNDGSIPSGPVLMKLAKALDMEPGELLPGAGKALHGKNGEDASERLVGARLLLAEVHDALREIAERWEKQGRAQAAADSAVHQQRHQGRKRKSQGT